MASHALNLIHQTNARGLSVQQASKDMAAVPGFQQALRDQRATLVQFAQLWPDEIRFEKRGTQNIMFAIKPAPPKEPRVALAPRPQEPGERLNERNARLDALLAASRAREDAAREQRKKDKNAILTQLRATRPRTPDDLAPTRVFAAPREPEAEPAPRPREPFLRLRRPAEP